MLSFLKHIIQIILSPQHGWEDVGLDNPDPKKLMRWGLMPMLLLAAVSEVVNLLIPSDITVMQVVIRSIVVFGAYFVSIYIAKLFFDFYMERLTDGKSDRRREATFIILTVGLMSLFRIVINLVHWHLVLLNFLPLYAILIIYKASSYVNVSRGNDFIFMVLASVACIVAPLLILQIFNWIIL